MYSKKEIGNKYTRSYKVYIKQDDEIISPLHDIPLWSGDNLRIVCTSPRFENAIFVYDKKRAFNPMYQPYVLGRMRNVRNIAPFKGYPWNCGFIPQTFQDPKVNDKIVGLKGNNCLLDVIDISNVKKNIGDVCECKVLGCLGVIVQEQFSWNIMVVDVRDEMAEKLNDVEDVEKVCPNLLDMSIVWFKDHMDTDQKVKFKFNGRFQNRNIALDVINGAHAAWKRMIDDESVFNISKINRTLEKHKLNRPFIVEGNVGQEGLPWMKTHEYYYCQRK
ncbi:Inorganic pyrophosphatase [Dictyocoela roeselum]|nr:Inorganic pyrophosphatase [Dictyocoela roeselum]